MKMTKWLSGLTLVIALMFTGLSWGSPPSGIAPEPVYTDSTFTAGYDPGDVNAPVAQLVVADVVGAIPIYAVYLKPVTCSTDTTEDVKVSWPAYPVAPPTKIPIRA